MESKSWISSSSATRPPKHKRARSLKWKSPITKIVRSVSFLRPRQDRFLRQKDGLEKASKSPYEEIAGNVTEKDIEELARIKMPDLNANELEVAKVQVRGTARLMGLTVI